MKNIVPFNNFDYLNEVMSEQQKTILTQNRERLAERKSTLKITHDKLKRLGFNLKHRNFATLKETYKTFDDKAKKIITKDHGKNSFYFDFEVSWYDNGTKASMTGCIGVNANRIIENYREEYDEQRKKYQYGFVVQGWVAGKLKEIINNLGFEVSGGSSGYSHSGALIYIYLSSGELD
jgi:hypothetical protein